MIYEWLERNRKDIDILTSFLVTVIPIIMYIFRSARNYRKYNSKTIEFLWRQQMAGGSENTGTGR